MIAARASLLKRLEEVAAKDWLAVLQNQNAGGLSTVRALGLGERVGKLVLR
jgi:hypothetical protein